MRSFWFRHDLCVAVWVLGVALTFRMGIAVVWCVGVWLRFFGVALALRCGDVVASCGVSLRFVAYRWV